MKPGAVNPTHVHPFDARLLVVDGAMTIERDGAPTQTYRTGETFEMPNGCRHSETAGDAGDLCRRPPFARPGQGRAV